MTSNFSVLVDGGNQNGQEVTHCFDLVYSFREQDQRRRDVGETPHASVADHSGQPGEDHVRYETDGASRSRGMQSQQGELFGYEVRESLVEKWGRACASCGAENVPLQIEHIQAKAQGRQ